MNKELVYGGLGFVLGVLITLAIFTFAPEENNMESKTDMTMSEMSKSLEGKSGTEFDLAFIDAMIDHHEGAIEMAKMALESTNRPQLLELANNIISAQESEINMMKNWKMEWLK